MTNNHSQRGHCPFGPSSHKALHSCPGYQGTDGTSLAAEIGTRVHEALEVRDPTNLESDEELAWYNMCIEAEDNLISEFFGDRKVERYNELQLDIPLNAGVSTWGTADVICVSGSDMLAIDYKTGKSSIDDVRENWQARAYTLGAFHKFPDVQRCKFYFLCPQQNIILDGEFTRDDVDILRHETTNVVANAQRVRAMWATGTPPKEELNPNDHCVWCRYATLCPALHGVAFGVAKKYKPLEVPDEVDLKKAGPAQLGSLYTIAKILEPLVKEIKAKAHKAASEGEAIPGWRLQSNGANAIAINNEEFMEYAEEFGISADEILRKVHIPVAKVRDILKERAPKGCKEDWAKNFVEQGVERGVIGKGAERLFLRPDAGDEAP